MNPLNYQADHALYIEEVSLAEMARAVGTPCYVYSRNVLETHYRAFQKACGTLSHQICFAVKSNSNLAVLNLLARLGAGFDIVSGGELARVLSAGGNANKIVFSGVGKTQEELQKALAANIYCFNVESAFELEMIQHIAKAMNKTASVALRINPDIPIDSHPYIATGLKESKFGIPYSDAFALYQKAKKLSHIEITGIACHIGSQITNAEPYILALEKLLELNMQLKSAGISLKHLDIGGGYGMIENDEPYTTPIKNIAQHAGLKNAGLTLLLEPGRAISAPAGLLLTRVLQIKTQGEKHFAIVDAAMNDLIRPALYEAKHEIITVKKIPPEYAENKLYDVVGPVCESGDFLGHHCALGAIQADDLLAIKTAGAYGFVMSSNYNTRARAAEVMVDKNQFYIIRPREKIEDLFASEICLPE